MELLNEWRKVGEIASQKAKKHEQKYKKIFSDSKNFKLFKDSIEKVKNSF